MQWIEAHDAKMMRPKKQRFTPEQLADRNKMWRDTEQDATTLSSQTPCWADGGGAEV